MIVAFGLYSEKFIIDDTPLFKRIQSLLAVCVLVHALCWPKMKMGGFVFCRWVSGWLNVLLK